MLFTPYSSWYIFAFLTWCATIAASPGVCPHPLSLVNILTRNQENVDQACLCPPQTVCHGSLCRSGHHKKSNQKISGYKPPCTDCRCVSLEDAAALQSDQTADQLESQDKLSISDTHINPDTNKVDFHSERVGKIDELNTEIDASNTDPNDAAPQSKPATNVSLIPERPQPALLKRRQCVQKYINDATSYPDYPTYFLAGCQHRAVYDFDSWSAESDCGIEEIEGDGMLYLHTAWSGPPPKNVTVLAMRALLESFLATQNLKTSKFFFWMDPAPSPVDPFVQEYTKLGAGSIEFRYLDLQMLAAGTCLEHSGQLGPISAAMKQQSQSNLVRILLLNYYGGVWIDTDCVIMRDLRYPVEFLGEFASKVTMHDVYNNNVLALRKGSAVIKALVNLVCDTPWSTEFSKRAHYCDVVGAPCGLYWYWNHGAIQYAINNNLGMVAVSAAYVDPNYCCFPPNMMSDSGCNQDMTHRASLAMSMDLVRGVMVLHTRGNQCKKPPLPESQYGRLYRVVSTLARTRTLRDATFTLFPSGPRNETESAALDTYWSIRRRSDPPFLPPTNGRRILAIVHRETSKCMVIVKDMSGNILAALKHSLVKTNRDKLEDSLWFWELSGNGTSAYIRSACRRMKRIMCLDAHAKQYIHSAIEPRPDNCVPHRLSQLWDFEPTTGFVRNRLTQACLHAPLVTDTNANRFEKLKVDLSMANCGDSGTTFDLVEPEFTRNEATTCGYSTA